ncbi:MAG: MBL fold metallo-hydrolase [Verrucomicrobiota bacterium]
MIRFVILGSGSGGNSAVVECGKTRLLVDAGLSAKQIILRLAQVGIPPETLAGILLTHEHGDHVRGLKTFLSKYPLPVYATNRTAQVVREMITGSTWRTFESGTEFLIGEITIRSFTVHHDAVDPVGFVLEYATRRFGFVSDAGHVTRSMIDSLRDLHVLFIEANYDDDLLMLDTKRPWATKQRISSRHGHLSNSQVEELLREISHPALRRVVLGHLSSDCNKPDLVLGRLTACVAALGHTVSLHCAIQEAPTEWFDCMMDRPAMA